MNKSLKFVSWFEIVGGVLAIAYSIFLAYIFQFAFPALVGAAVLTSAAVLSIIAGFLLLKSKKVGWYLSLLTQLIQLPVFSLNIALWRLGLGAFSAVGFDIPKISSTGGHLAALIEFNLGGSFLFSLGRELEDQYFAVNLVALVLLCLLFFNRKQTTNLTHHSSGTPNGAA
jgi:hypothetical protein